MSSDSHATITYTSMSSYEVIVNGFYEMPMDPLDPYPLPAAVSPTVESLGYIMELEPEMEPKEEDGDDEKSEEDSIEYPTRYIMELEPEMEPKEEDGDDEKSEEDSIEYPTSGGDDDADDDGDDLSDDDVDDEDEEESSDSEEEQEEHLASTVPTPALYKVERLLAIPTPPLSPVSPTSYPLPPFLMPLPIFTPLPTSSFPLPSSLPSTSGSESIPEADIPLRKRARFTTPTGGYEKMAPKRARTTRANPNPTRTTTATEPMTHEAINNLIAQRVAKALAEYETQRNSVVNEDTSNTTGTRPRTVCPTRECTYKDYLNCGLLKFNGTEGVIGEGHGYHQLYSSFPRVNFVMRENVSRGVRRDIKKAIESANDQMDQKLLGIVDRQANNKRKFDNTSRNQQNQQPFRRNNNVAHAYVAGSGEKPYRGTKPLCPKCNFYHDGPCRPKCTNCKRTGHIARDYRSQAANTNNNNNNNNYNNRRATTAYQGGNQNQAGNGNDVARAYGLGTAGGNPDANVVT
nr:hypothetical protein [Tanacetum cinerariifolium]